MEEEDSRPEANPPVPRFEKDSVESHPVVWTPEDASRFLTSAIREAQRPLADELAKRPVTTKILALIITILVVAAVVVALVLSGQIAKSDQTAERAIAAHSEAMTQKQSFQTRAELLEDRLSAAQTLHERLRGSVEELKRARGDLQRFRRQNDLLRSQITGLEMEKMALSRQLDALKSLSLGETDMDPADQFDDLDTLEDPFRDLAPQGIPPPEKTDSEDPSDDPAIGAVPETPAPASPLPEESPPGGLLSDQPAPPKEVASTSTAVPLPAVESTASETAVPSDTPEPDRQTAQTPSPPIHDTPPPIPSPNAAEQSSPPSPPSPDTVPASQADAQVKPRVEISRGFSFQSPVGGATLGSSTPVELRPSFPSSREVARPAVTITGRQPLYEAAQALEAASREFDQSLREEAE